MATQTHNGMKKVRDVTMLTQHEIARNILTKRKEIIDQYNSRALQILNKKRNSNRTSSSKDKTLAK